MLLLAALVPACKAAQADRPESHTTLSGTAQFPNDLPTTYDGSVRMTIKGHGKVTDSCNNSGSTMFTATYDGQLVVQPDGRFDAALYPNPIVTANGCAAGDLHEDHVDTIQLDATLGDEVGTGNLNYQTLTAVDGNELQKGAFDDLVGELIFRKP